MSFNLPPLIRREVTDGLVLRCSHVVLNKDQIVGLLTVENTGKESVALVDRWNSWGAYQWRLTIGEQTAVNPQVCWWANFYSETAIAPGEVRHSWFSVTWVHPGGEIRKGAWHFDVRKPFEMTVDENGKEVVTFKPFEVGQPLILLFQAIKPMVPEPPEGSAVPLWTGIAVATSKEVNSELELEALVKGNPLR
jgi:hypothetical protein